MLSSAAATESTLSELPWLLAVLHIISPKYARCANKLNVLEAIVILLQREQGVS
ncbi:hypothetical protein GQ55_9G351200 [Panicum hallii var. hallii]|uniref:Uncharacterized protein n=1 Tax=Panicum hallii var. hallii TaxID=1504633 RepID=A0A2T7C8J2_9POAL|nr:hypothetical protein GQ55_9G300000 [Panicum hallii var. hallii]PUZ39659.1 hypothetical protein GQ55_9G351200 [Panicum hallii var. hallii]